MKYYVVIEGIDPDAGLLASCDGKPVKDVQVWLAFDGFGVAHNDGVVTEDVGTDDESMIENTRVGRSGLSLDNLEILTDDLVTTVVVVRVVVIVGFIVDTVVIDGSTNLTVDESGVCEYVTTGDFVFAVVVLDGHTRSTVASAVTVVGSSVCEVAV